MYDVIIIGTGFGGISTAINLNKAGITNYIMLERRQYAGGTWQQNKYPGAAVDVQSLLYSIENEPYDWSRLFAVQSELCAYTEHLLNKHKLHDKILLNMNVEKAAWQGDFWQVETDDKQVFKATAVINATGPLSTPVIPKFKRMAAFKGRAFHTNDWPQDIDLAGKRIAIIGTGASAAQVIPELAKDVAALHVFQRTPHWVLPRHDIVLPRWVRELLKYKAINTLGKSIIYWLLELRVMAFKYSKPLLRVLAEIPARRLLKRQVKDAALRKKLTPNFTIGCKRILLSNTFLPALQRPNVILHNKQDAIIEFTEGGIKTADSEIDVDVVIFATGYDPQTSIVSYYAVGKHEVSLNTQWQAFPRAYLGTSMPYFPNFFVVTGPNTGIGHTSAIHIIESQMLYIMQCMKILKNGAKTIEPTEYAEDQYTAMIHQEMKKTVWHYGGCKSWYQNASGKVIAMFPGFSFSFRRLCKQFKRNDHNIR